MQVGRWARAHGRRMAVEVANVVLNHDVVFRAIGVVNRRVGLVASHGILTDPPEGDITAHVVAEAVRNVRDGDWAGTPVIVLGGRGFVGRRLVATLLREGIQVHSVDVCDDRDCWPEHLVGTHVVLVNVANRHALARNLDRLWPGMIVLNEVYPEPDQVTLAELTARGIPVHHVVGVQAHAIPPFPAAYRGAIPCCAAWPSEQAQVVVRHLNPEVLPAAPSRPSPEPLPPRASTDAPTHLPKEQELVHARS